MPDDLTMGVTREQLFQMQQELRHILWQVQAILIYIAIIVTLTFFLKPVLYRKTQRVLQEVLEMVRVSKAAVKIAEQHASQAAATAEITAAAAKQVLKDLPEGATVQVVNVPQPAAWKPGDPDRRAPAPDPTIDQTECKPCQ